MWGSIPLITFGVKPRVTRFRRRVCCGGSWLSIISSVPSPWSSSSAPPRADEKVFVSRSMSMTSWYLVHTQNPGGEKSLSCQYTGCSLRSRVKYSCGTPAASVSGSERSMSASMSEMRATTNPPGEASRTGSILGRE